MMEIFSLVDSVLLLCRPTSTLLFFFEFHPREIFPLTSASTLLSLRLSLPYPLPQRFSYFFI